MDKENIIAQKLADILPDRPVVPGMSGHDPKAMINKEAASIKSKQTASELAKIKYAERGKLKRLEAKRQEHQQLAEELGLDEIPEGMTKPQAIKYAEQKKRVETLEAIEAQAVEPLSIEEITKNVPASAVNQDMINNALKLQGTSRPEMAKLLAALNINLSIQLTKTDTANLLACLLTCNEGQLAALYSNKKIPIVIKTIIKRLQEDVKLGNIDTIEKLWDRLFGKGQMQLDLPAQTQLQTGIIPNVPVSREAYLIIRDTLLQ